MPPRFCSSRTYVFRATVKFQELSYICPIHARKLHKPSNIEQNRLDAVVYYICTADKNKASDITLFSCGLKSTNNRVE